MKRGHLVLIRKERVDPRQIIKLYSYYRIFYIQQKTNGPPAHLVNNLVLFIFKAGLYDHKKSDYKSCGDEETFICCSFFITRSNLIIRNCAIVTFIYIIYHLENSIDDSLCKCKSITGDE